MFRLLAGKKLKDKVRVQELSKRFNMMSINQMACYHVLVETYNIIHYGSSKKIRDKIVSSCEYSRSLTVPLFRKSSCRSFSYYASRLWNTLPADIRAKGMCKEKSNQRVEETKKLNSFKRDIKQWIFNGGVPFR